MKALLKNYHQSPRKVRLVANLIRGKSVLQARTALQFLPKKSSPAIVKLLNSAVSNARNSGLTPESLFVKKIAVDKGVVMRRFNPMARGRSAGYNKTMSIITLELGESAKSTKASKKVAKPKSSANTKAKKPKASK